MGRHSTLAAFLILLACGGESIETSSGSSQPMACDSSECAPPTVSTSVRIEAGDEALLFGYGRVTGLLVEEGDSVRAGQLLVSLSGDRLAENAVNAGLQAMEAARINALNSEREYERCSGLYEAGAISAMTLEGVETAMLAAGSSLLEARAGVAGAMSGQSSSTVQAPFQGVVGRVWIHEGNLAGGAPLLMLTGGNGFVARALLPEREIGLIEPGTSAVFVTSALPDVTFESTVTSVSPSLDPVTCLLPVTVQISDRDGLLAPGMYGIITIDK